jgi:hypothetical protein
MTNSSMDKDWRYSEERMELRQKCYTLLLGRFGSQSDENGEPIYSMQSISECSHDWVSQGNVNTSGLVKYYQAYYTT